MANINPTDPRTFKSDAIRYNAISAVCSKCEERMLRSNLISTKDGQLLCEIDFARYLDNALAAALEKRNPFDTLHENPFS